VYPDPALTCPLCHTSDFDIVRSPELGFVVLCNECGYATRATVRHLMAS
jgi:uncharacterized Zn finger protein